jgi:predicted transposase/invertase (TIGR01784 family)
MMRKFLKPTADPVFKRIFGKEKEIAIEFINLFIDPPKPVVEITFLEQEMLGVLRDGKISVVDVRCTDSNNQHFILEMQVIHHEGFLDRQLLYACKAYDQQFTSGLNYKERQPVYLLTIIEQIILPDTELWLHAFSFRHEELNNINIPGLHIRVLELGKRKILGNFNMENAADRWMTFLAEPEKLITMPKFDISVYPNLMKAVEILDTSNFTPGQHRTYTNHLFAVADINYSRMESYDKGFDEGIERGIEKGRVEGMAQGLKLSIDIIKDLQNGITHEAIAGKYDISLEEVERLAKEFE